MMYPGAGYVVRTILMYELNNLKEHKKKSHSDSGSTKPVCTDNRVKGNHLYLRFFIGFIVFCCWIFYFIFSWCQYNEHRCLNMSYV